MLTFRCLVFLALAFSATISPALPPPPGKPPVRSYGMDEYGGHLTNWVVRQAPDQRIVVGGGAGLVIFDGANWQSIHSRHRNRIRVMEIDPSGRIWIGSSDEFGYFDPGQDGGLVYHSLSDQLPEELRDFGEIRGLHQIGGAIYFHALRHLFRWQDDNLDIVQAGDGVFRITVNHQGRFLVLVRNRFHDYTDFPADGQAPPAEDGWSMPEGPRLSMLASWPDGRILMGSVDDGLFWLSEDAPVAIETDFELAGTWPYQAIPAPDGGILLATQQAGLFHLRADGKALEQITHRNGLAVNSIYDLIIDHENGVWLAQGGAIARVDLFGGRRFYDADFGLATTNALVPFQGRWMVGGDAGLSVLAADGNDASRLDTIDAPILEVFGLLADGDGLLVAGSEGVHRMVPDLDGLGLSEHEQLLADTYSYGLVRSRLRDAVYAELETGLGALIRTDQGWRSLGRIGGVDHRAHTIAEDDQGRVWVGTVAGRYYRLAWQDDALAVEAQLGADEGVPEGYAWAFNLGERLVLGTSNGGYRPVEPEATRIEPDPDFGNQTLGEPRGIYRLYQTSNGQLVGGIGPGGALWRGQRSDDGRFDWQGRWLSELAPAVNWFIGERGDHLWIGRHPGLLRLDWPPVDIDIEPSRLQVVRAGFPDSGQWLIQGPGNRPLEQALPAGTESLRFEYALSSYIAPDLTEYRVRLEGLESDWSRWSDETRRDYTNLPGGHYVFRAQARNAAGQVFESEPLGFRVLPPFYASPLAWGMYVLAGLSLLALAARFGQRARETRLIAQQRVLSEQVAERTAELRARSREIRQISDARARFFANVSHELRTPLTLTRGPLQELARISGEQLDAEAKQYLDVALRNSEAMQSLIGQVLDLQRLDAGRMPLRLIKADPAQIVRGIVDRFAVQARLRQVELVCQGTDQPRQWVCDQAHIDTMLSNLLSNALKFTPAGGRITVELKTCDKKVEVTVSDTGPGIDPADQQAIFERYRQGEASSASSPGTGIGLALVRELAELHGGQVEVASTPGHGACFRLVLPADLRANATPGEPTNDTPTNSSSDLVSGHAAIEDMTSEDVPCVLLVDDNAELRAFLRLRLGRSYRIEEAADGAEGLAKARAITPDAIITDGLMPVMDGLAMTREIKADPELAFVPVLMLTSRAAPEDTVRGLESGADDYLSKPFDSAELAARVAGLIASRRRLKAHLEEAGPSNAEVSESPFMARVNQLLEANLPDPGFSIRDWAELLHMDRSTLFRRLKNETGQSPEEYLREMRLQTAARLLAERAGNVAEVAEAVGFASVSHFSRRFRKRFESTPATYSRDHPR
ncbi:hybrid sensor histidine kinase/response regulator transcription factor [Wenzhouxiangella limi]|uniref:histidine kinase n=1 Tax=Wenzhouxiangella limi TaxID=2707351 RepID=A0A845V4B4_9GAMM|nr:hybrid sensor histidine kinase/response regulator transcription factor [Wenzhouxiangella limi]NDY95071.1 response regulator [Wenzhouxiangella limi]